MPSFIDTLLSITNGWIDRASGYVLASTSAVLLYYYVKWRWSPLRRIPGPPRSFWSGNFVEIQVEPFLDPHKRWIRQLGAFDDKKNHHPILVYSYLLGSETVLVLDKHLVRTILSNNKL